VKSLVLLCAAVIPLTMTAACGQKGPLYLPPRNGTVVTRPAGSNTTPNTPPKTDQQPSTPQATPPQTPDSGPAPKKNNNDSSQPPK
jgi:predicted small lipoprotein YifL